MRACFAIALDTLMKHSDVGNFVKMKADAKCLVWNFFANYVNTADGRAKDFNSVYCNNCL